MIRISDHIVASGGWISLEKFMEVALYDPDGGYYSSNIKNIGSRGDFSTSATMSPLLGKALMNEWKKANLEAGFMLPVIEVGAGNASLALAFIDSVGFWGKFKLKYHIVETSPTLRDFQKVVLRGSARIHQDMPSALDSCKGKAFIFSNELVDAFPARVFEQTENGWMEVGLSIENNKIVESLRSITKHPAISTALECDTHITQRVEVHESYHNWFLSWLPKWKSGMMTTIDYGDELQNVYYRKPKGTLRAFRHHQLLTGMDVYAHAGTRDITCDINFSDLLALQTQCMGDEVSLYSQNEYLEPYKTNSRQDRYLTKIDGPGSYFKVLTQKRLGVS